MRRRIWIVSLAAAVLLAAGVGAYVFRDKLIGAEGGLDDWLGRQVVGIASSYLVPQIAFEGLAYQPPGALTLTGVTLTSPDDVEVVRVGTLRVRLGEVPRPGRPIVISEITVEGGSLNLIAEPGGGFKGLVPFAKGTPRKPPQDVPEDFRLSRVMRLERVRLDGGSLRFDPGDGTPPMELDNLALDLVIEGGGDGEWHALKLETGRAPGLTVALDGKLSLDTLDAEVSSGTLELTAGPETIQSLPGELQELLTELEARGRVKVQLSGNVPALDWKRAAVATTVLLSEFNISAADYRVPIDSFELALRLKEGQATIEECHGTLLGGDVSLGGQASLATEPRAATATWSAYNLNLKGLMRSPGGEAPPKLAGILNGSGNAELNLAAIPGSLKGSGALKVRDGRLLMIPGLRELADVMDVRINPMSGATKDHADVEFDLTGEGIRVTKSTITTAFLAARGTGLVGYDGSLNMAVNAGPLERLQGALGQVGELFGELTDQLMKYRVRGTVADPKVSVEPLGIGMR